MTRPAPTVTARYRYRFKGRNSEDYLDQSYATRDTAVQECKALTKKLGVTIFVVDSTCVPSRILGCASSGHWRNATKACKACSGKGMFPNYGECGECLGWGMSVEPMPWTGN